MNGFLTRTIQKSRGARLVFVGILFALPPMPANAGVGNPPSIIDSSGSPITSIFQHLAGPPRKRPEPSRMDGSSCITKSAHLQTLVFSERQPPRLLYVQKAGALGTIPSSNIRSARLTAM
jgi:hypothetical protein